MLIDVEYRRIAGARNATNVITIVSREWRLWLDYRPSENPADRAKEVHAPRPDIFPTLLKREIGTESARGSAANEAGKGEQTADRSKPASAAAETVPMPGQSERVGGAGGFSCRAVGRGAGMSTKAIASLNGSRCRRGP